MREIFRRGGWGNDMTNIKREREREEMMACVCVYERVRRQREYF